MEVTVTLVQAVATHAGLTEVFIKDAGFTSDSRIANNILNELNAVLPHSKTAMTVIKASETVDEVIASIKKQTTKSLLNRAVTNLKEKLEAKATNIAVVVGKDGVIEFTGTLNIDGDGSSTSEYKTYGAMLLRDIVKASFADTGIEALTKASSYNNAVMTFLDTEESWAMMDEFNANFSTGLAVGEYRLGLGERVFTITKEDSEEHKQVLVDTLNQHGLLEAFSESVNATAKAIVEAQTTEGDEELEQEEVKVSEEVMDLEVAVTEEAPAEEVVTISVAEYNALLTVENIHNTNIDVLAKANAEITQKDAYIVKAGERIAVLEGTIETMKAQYKAELEKVTSAKDAQIKALEAALKEAKSVSTVKADTNKTNKPEGEIGMQSFKIEIKDLKEVVARPTKQGKVVSRKVIDNIELEDGTKAAVGNVVKAQVVTVDVLKGFNNTVRTKTPELVVKGANATHTGIDKVAEVAHKTTNVIAKATNTTVLKSANAVDAVLDFIAPTEKRVDVSALRKSLKDAQPGDVVEIAGREYKCVGENKYEPIV